MPKRHREAARMNQWFINVLITVPQYVSRLATLLLKCQIQYQWGIETLSGIVMKTCQGAKMQTEGGCDSESSSLEEDFSVSSSVLTFSWLLKGTLSTINLKISRISQVLLPDKTYGGLKQKTYYAFLCSYYPGRYQPLKHSQRIAATAAMINWIHCPSPASQ